MVPGVVRNVSKFVAECVKNAYRMFSGTFPECFLKTFGMIPESFQNVSRMFPDFVRAFSTTARPLHFPNACQRVDCKTARLSNLD